MLFSGSQVDDMYVYSGSRVKCKCHKCDVEKENYIWEFLN